MESDNQHQANETVLCSHDPEADYEAALAAIRNRFAEVVGQERPLFTTDATDLFRVFLDALPPGERQRMTCHECRRFIERYGHLVSIGGLGLTTPVMWDGDAPSFYGPAFEAVRKVVARARVTGVFLSGRKTWGTPETGPWRHMYVTPPSSLLFRSALRNDGQEMAERRQEYAMLQRGLAEFPAAIVQQALTILEADALYRSEKVIGPARWLAALHARRADAKGAARDNVTWLAVATAPQGYCHVRSTMIGTLLEDLAAGIPFETVKRRFNEKMHPLQYQRPQAPPSAGHIARAEKIVAELKSAGALARRFARLEDIRPLWTPKPAEAAQPSNGSVFGHLAQKGKAAAKPLELPPQTMTWAKFRTTVLSTAERIEFLVPQRASYLAFVTAADPDAPPILQWDSPERRNPVNWYVYHNGSFSSRWGLRALQAVPVTAITLLPFMWDDESKYAHQGAGVVFVLDGCRDMDPCGGLALFPEVLRAEYREIRATIEAYSLAGTIAGKDEATACGLDLRKGARWGYAFRVYSKGSAQPVNYMLDRWD